MRWISLWFSSLSRRLPSHLVQNGSWTLFASDKASAAFALVWARFPFAAERVVVAFRALVVLGSHSLPNGWWFVFAPEWVVVCICSRMGFGPLCPSVSALPICYRTGIGPLWSHCWIRFPFATEWVVVRIRFRMGVGPLHPGVSALSIRCRMGIGPVWSHCWVRFPFATELVVGRVCFT